MKKIVLIALSAISIFLTFWIYRNYFKPQNVLRPTELSDKNIYEKIARSAGGEVVHIDTGSSPEKMNDFIQMNYEENNYVLLWAAEGETISHEILTEFQIDQNIKKISILVSGLNKKPEVEVFNPRKQKVTFTKVLESKQSIKQIFDHPEQGKWKLKISSSENIQVKILALSDLLVSPPEPVELRGRPGHEGYFQYRGTFVSGSKVKFNSDLSTIKLSSNKDMNIKSSEISLLSLGGKTLESGTVNSDFRIPAEPFRTLITWTDGEGRSGQRMSQRIFEPNKLPLVSFSMNSDQPTSQEFCDLINSSASWNLFAEAKTGASVIVSCNLSDDIQGLKLKTHISLAVPWDQRQKTTTVVLSQSDLNSLTKENCLNIEKIFSKFPKIIKNKENLSASLTFSCVGGPSRFNAILNIKVFQNN